MCTLWMIKKLVKVQCKVMCKCSYIDKEDGTTTNRRRKKVLASSVSSSQRTARTNRLSSPSSPASQARNSTAFLSSPRGSQGGIGISRFASSPRRSQALEPRSATWLPARDEAARIVLPLLKRGKLKRRVTIGSNQSASSGSGDVEEADWPPFADEDYIVFCFEEDGAFHVVLEESPKNLTADNAECEYHGTVSCACTDQNSNVNHLRLTKNRRDCMLPNQEAEKEEELCSPKLQQDGTNKGNDLLRLDELVIRKKSTESLECINGSVESTDSSRLDWEEQLLDESTLEVAYSSSPRNIEGGDENDDNAAPDFWRVSSVSDTMFETEEIYLSPRSEMGLKMTINDLLKASNDDSYTGSDESSGFSGSDAKDDCGDQLVENEELSSESPKSSVSNQSASCASSFEFPVLQWEWIDSPVTWPKSGRIQFRKQKSKPAYLKCCRF